MNGGTTNSLTMAVMVVIRVVTPVISVVTGAMMPAPWKSASSEAFKRSSPS